MLDWADSRFSGMLTQLVRVEPRPHDPAVPMTAAEVPPWHPEEPQVGCGGAGWSREESDLACVGEAFERVLARALPGDASLEASWNELPVDEPAIEPERWVLFHADQYAVSGFPFVPFTRATPCRWVCCREAVTGTPAWVPEELVYLSPRRGECQRLTPGLSTGLSCGPFGTPVLLRGAQEVIERDALLGGWWGKYPVEEWQQEQVRPLIGETIWRRIERPNLRYRFYRIASPLSGHVTMVSVEGRDLEGEIFSIGSACRETRATSWRKALLEAIQGRHCVRRLLARWQETNNSSTLTVPTTFLEHALYFTLQPAQRARSVLEHAIPGTEEGEPEPLEVLRSRLGQDRPILFRHLTPPGFAQAVPDWYVLRVVIPGLQPLHGDHRLPFLGGNLWNRPARAWADLPPHPFA